MKISLNWLADYIDLKGIPVDQIISTLNMSGLEVEDVINEREIYKDFIVASVLEKTKHPNADKLSLCKVSDGKILFRLSAALQMLKLIKNSFRTHRNYNPKR